MLLPFHQAKKTGNGSIVFAGDIGATKTNLAMYKVDNGEYHLLQQAKLVSKDYHSITELTEKFTRNIPQPDAICFGVAGPVLNGHATLSNLQWEIDIKEITALYKTANVHLINDLKATAYGLAVLKEKDISVVHEGNSTIGGNAAIIAPGTGLGEAGLYWDGEYYHPFATEGGHADFAARNSFDFELHTYLRQQFEHVSWERLVCGPGIVNIYQFLRDEKKMEEPGWLAQKMTNADKAATISENVDQCPVCKETMRCFIQYLAHESANLVLKLNATGGLFIGGGIAPQIVHLFENGAFYSSFRQSGRLNFLLEKVPVKIILNRKTALLGAAYYAATQ